MDYDELGLSEGSDEPAAKPKKKAEGKKKAPAGVGGAARSAKPVAASGRGLPGAVRLSGAGPGGMLKDPLAMSFDDDALSVSDLDDDLELDAGGESGEGFGDPARGTAGKKKAAAGSSSPGDSHEYSMGSFEDDQSPRAERPPAAAAPAPAPAKKM